MLPRKYATEICSIARTLEILGDRWTPLVVRAALTGMRRFDDYASQLDISPNVLSDRLARLIDEGILLRRPYQQRPVRYEYLPTDKGLQLWQVLAAMMEWGDRYYAPNGAPRVLLHRDCGGEIHQYLRCAACRSDIDAADVTSGPGPAMPVATSSGN